MREELRQKFDTVVGWARWMTTSPLYREPYYRNAAIRQATDQMRVCLESGLTLTDAIELARHALRRLREEFPEENEFRRTVGWLTYFIYTVCSDRLVQGQPKDKSTAVAMARACLPLLAIADDDQKRENPFSLAVRTLAPYIVLLPYQSDTSSNVEKLRELLTSYNYDNDVRAVLGTHYERLKQRLLDALSQPTDAENADEMEDYIMDVLSRVRTDASLPRELFVDLSAADRHAVSPPIPLWRLFILHLAFLPKDQQNQLIRESASRMESFAPMRVRDAFYTALTSLHNLYAGNFIGESVYRHLNAMFRYRMLPVLGKFADDSMFILEVLEKDYGISPYHALGLFAWDKILSGDPPPDIHRAQQRLYESFANALCAKGLDNDPFA
jgi:hypothetical protein